jgi:hypothetical protein
MTLHALSLFAAVLGFGQVTDRDSYKHYFDLAEQAKAKGDYASMEANLAEALKNGAGDEYAWRSLAWAQMLEGKWRESLSNAKENVRRNGETTWSLKQLFESAVEAGDLDLAGEALGRESRLPTERRNADMKGEREDFLRLTKPTAIDISFKIVVKDYEVDNGVIYLQAPLSRHLWQTAETTVEGAKEWKMVRDGRWDVLEIRPGDAAELFVKTHIVHKPRILGWKKVQAQHRTDIPASAKVCLGPFINSQTYDPSNAELQKVVKDLKGKTPAETVQNVLDWLAKNMRYEFGHSDKLEDILASHRGVCHHYANLTVCMCRALGVPAVVAHGSHFPDRGTFKDSVPSHGWAEVYLGELGWVPIDPLSPNTLRTFRAPGYVIVDTSGYGPEDNHFYMKTSDGHHLQSIQGAPGTGSADLADVAGVGR